MKKSNQFENLLYVYLPFFTIPLFCLLAGVLIFYNYDGDLKKALLSMGSVCLIGGMSWGFTLKLDPIGRLRGKKVLTLEATPETTKHIQRMQQLQEFSSLSDVVVKALAYYDMALEAAHEDGAEITIRRKDGTTERFDPISLESPPPEF